MMLSIYFFIIFRKISIKIFVNKGFCESKPFGKLIFHHDEETLKISRICSDFHWFGSCFL